MTRKPTQARYIDEREQSGAIDFDAALEAYLEGGDPEELLQAAGKVRLRRSMQSRRQP